MKKIIKALGGLLLLLGVQNSVQAQEYADPTKVLENGKAPGLKHNYACTAASVD